ncbi:hypothetical protein P255_00495 [Acinetobacter brisouii CIP 110357]|uniref:O-methyltransferase domain-containing protein n=1 Tax=Acinetobacter brisouii CIP 110357 TaxID=1341683 RepID=V2VX91_9GAMM|nr:hypothetical protein F954_02335 [Acinetobacter brisouii ANC 4119]ESK52344.1 hypothetical protein P255_00495 [Acinetobacter brisouii CIP 110357]
MFGKALYHACLASDEYQRLWQQYGFEVVEMIAEDGDCTGRTVWLAQKQPQ